MDELLNEQSGLRLASGQDPGERIAHKVNGGVDEDLRAMP
jgi:hypothetical protein